MRSEELTRKRIAGESKGSALKIGSVQSNGAGPDTSHCGGNGLRV